MLIMTDRKTDLFSVEGQLLAKKKEVQDDESAPKEVT
jgi:hypothetical protein